MKLLQVVMCVVMGLLGPKVMQFTQAFTDDFTEVWYHDLTSYNSEPWYARNVNRTLFPKESVDLDEDANSLHEAMAGLKKDEALIARMMSSMTFAQRSQLEKFYKSVYNVNLDEELHSELSYEFRSLVKCLMMPLPKYMAYEFSNEKHLYPYTEDLMEILLGFSNRGIREVKEFFVRDFKRTMVAESQGIKGYSKGLILALLKGERDEGITVDHSSVNYDAKALDGASVNTLIWIFTRKSYQHLRKVFVEFKKIKGEDIEVAMMKLLSTDPFKDGIMAIVQRAKSKTGYFAGVLRANRSPESVARVILSRCEIDLADIKKEYQKKYNSTVTHLINSLVWINSDAKQVLHNLAGK